METTKRILLECRYLISLNKSYYDLAKIFNVSVDTIKFDINIRLKDIDQELFYRVKDNIAKNNLVN